MYKHVIANYPVKPMPSKPLTLKNRRGLHARASAKVQQLLRSFDAEITLSYGDQHADASSIMSIMTLAAAQGSTVQATAKGPEAEAALAALHSLFDRRFDEDE